MLIISDKAEEEDGVDRLGAIDIPVRTGGAEIVCEAPAITGGSMVVIILKRMNEKAIIKL